jgi:DNA-binding transcriptional LysR family regulator
VDVALRQLQAVLAVAETRSFTAAGKRLRLSQQSVSALVRNVEERLGVPLFVRSTRSVKPTAACDALAPEIRTALDTLTRAIDRTRNMARAEPPLRLGITPSVAFGELKILLEALEGRLPAEPDVREVWADELLSGLIEGRLDAGLGVEVRPARGMVIRPWRRQRIDLLVARSHPFAQLPAVEVSQLAGATLVIPGQERNGGLYDAILATLARVGVRPVLADAPRVSGPAPVAVERGLAATVWLTGMDDGFLPQGLVRAPLGSPETFVTTSLVTTPSAITSASASLEALTEAVERTRAL